MTTFMEFMSSLKTYGRIKLYIALGKVTSQVWHNKHSNIQLPPLKNSGTALKMYEENCPTQRAFAVNFKMTTASIQ